MAAPIISLGKDPGIRVDFKTEKFDLQIRQKGYRIYWSRSILCPCLLNSKTEQPDPSCTVCFGDGYFYVHPDVNGPIIKEYLEETPPFTDRLIDGDAHSPPAKATQGVLTHMTKDPQIFEKFGEWISGVVRLTTFSFNLIAYRDRFEMLDSVMGYQQLIEMPSDQIIRIGRDRADLRYIPVTILKIFSVSGSTKTEFTNVASITANGIEFDAGKGPAPKTIVVVAYEMHPIWIIIEHVYTVRDTLRSFKTPKILGDFKTMPMHSMAKLEFLIGR